MTAAPPRFKLRWSPEPSAAPAHRDDVAALEALGFSRAGQISGEEEHDHLEATVWRAADPAALASAELLFGVRVVSFTSVSSDGRTYRTLAKRGDLPFPGTVPLSNRHEPAPRPSLLQRWFDPAYPIAYALPRHGAWCDVLDDVTVDDAWRHHLSRCAALGFAPAPLEGADAVTLSQTSSRHAARFATAGSFLSFIPLVTWTTLVAFQLASLDSAAAPSHPTFAAELLLATAASAGGLTGLLFALGAAAMPGG